MTDPFSQATPADLAEQAAPVDDDGTDSADLPDAPLESDPADYQEQNQSVPVDEDYR
jgi:hypothetical protein